MQMDDLRWEINFDGWWRLSVNGQVVAIVIEGVAGGWAIRTHSGHHLVETTLEDARRVAEVLVRLEE